MQDYSRLQRYADKYFEQNIIPLDRQTRLDKLTAMINSAKKGIEYIYTLPPDQLNRPSAWMRGLEYKVDDLESAHNFSFIEQLSADMVRKYGFKNIMEKIKTSDVIEFLNNLSEIFKHLKTRAGTENITDVVQTRSAELLDEDKLINEIADIITEDPNIGYY